MLTGAAACIIHDNKLLLLQQSAQKRHEGRWGPPGGVGKPGESLTNTAIRETREEAGLKIKITGLVWCGIVVDKSNKNIAVAIYSARVLGSNKVDISNPDIDNYKWITLQGLKRGTVRLREPYLKEILIRSLSEKPKPINTFSIVSSSEVIQKN